MDELKSAREETERTRKDVGAIDLRPGEVEGMGEDKDGEGNSERIYSTALQQAHGPKQQDQSTEHRQDVEARTAEMRIEEGRDDLEQRWIDDQVALCRRIEKGRL